MSSEVDICNIALAHLGDDATVASLDPPEGSAQAEHCARFYPQARDALLDMHEWNFATRRATLAAVAVDTYNFSVAYARPSSALRVISILSSTESSGAKSQEFEILGDEILTDLENATALYTVVVTDTTKFSPLFSTVLSWHLASMLAGSILKGETGAAEAKRCLAMVQMYLSKAAVSDANQRNVTPAHTPAWIGDR